MLMQMAIENFKSIQNKVYFSMMATNENIHLEYVHQVANFQLLPSSLITGPNGAGKSNLFLVISHLQDILKSRQVTQFPHRLNEHQPTEIDIQFIKDEDRFAYGIDILNHEIINEYLYLLTNDEIVIFERENNHYFYNGHIYDCDINLPLLPLLLKDIRVDKAYHFLTEDLVVILSEDEILPHLLIDRFKQNENIVNHLLKNINMGIQAFIIKDKEIFVKYDQMDIKLSDESTGNKKLFFLLLFISQALKKGQVLFIDELENNLHKPIIEFIINLFNNPNINTEHAQLFFSTHATSLLNLSLFRKDQVWFMEKDTKTLTTEMYALYNISDIDSLEDIEKGYVKGKYGATYQFIGNGVTKYGE